LINCYVTKCLIKCINNFFVVLGMTDNVGRKRLGWRSVAHSSTCRERATEAPNLRRGRGRKGYEEGVGSSS
jgi:hypothetical protein